MEYFGSFPDIGNFQQKVPKKGYCWDGVAVPISGRDYFPHPRVADLLINMKDCEQLIYLIEKPENDEHSFYKPLSITPPLFLKFAKLEQTKESILDFANNYGFLMEQGETIVNTPKYAIAINPPTSEQEKPIPVSKPHWWEKIRSGRWIKEESIYYANIPGESLATWVNEITEMKHLIQIWKWIKEGDEDSLGMVIRWDSNNRGVLYYIGSEDALVDYYHLAPKNQPQNEEIGFGILASKDFNKEIFAKFSTGDPYLPAEFLIKSLINQKIVQYPTYPYFTDFKNYSDHSFMAPTSLIAALWFQFYQAVKGERTIKWCKYCGMPEDITDNKNSWTMHKDCANALRQKRYRVSEAIINGKKTLQQGASQLNISVAEMKKLVNNKSDKGTIK